MTAGEIALTATAALAAAAWLGAALMGLRISRALDVLAGDPAPPASGWPRLAVVVPCRDEERRVEAAVRSLLAQDLPGLTVVAVDDRSTDATGAILDRLAAEAPRLAVVHLRELPPGWVGKNHACHAGARASQSDWILFTDGDVLFAQGALRSALAFASSHRLGHLVALPRLETGGALERAFVSGFAALLAFALRVWDLRRPGTRAFLGVGAFNLVRRTDYLAVGGHARLALEVADDVKLGLVLRRSGVAQGVVDAGGLVSVRWQAGLRASLLGLVKNAFAGFEYRWGLALPAVAVLLLLAAAPLAALLGPPPAVALGLFATAVAGAIHGAVARRFCAGAGWEGLLALPAVLTIAGVFLASAAVISVRGAVVWRGTRYPLADLRRACVREGDWPPARSVGWK